MDADRCSVGELPVNGGRRPPRQAHLHLARAVVEQCAEEVMQQPLQNRTPRAGFPARGV
jgi:hypothetical protein